ncbi:MAG TPA: amino acid adenylation domain-containing protein [Thermoanaerobaculia bacterium]
MNETPFAPPTETSTLVELLRRRAQLQPERRAYTFLLDGEREEVHLSVGELDRQARSIASRLQALGVRGERALLLYPPGLQYAAAFFGCLYAGVTAVPVYPPRPNRPDPRLLAILSDARARVVLTTSAIRPNAERLLAGEAKVLWLATDGVDAEGAEEWREPGVKADDLAFLQYTSGSTSAPKGVMVSHGNLIHNERLIERAFGMGADSVVVGWLPLYHDMGLIGNLLQPLWVGCSCVLMSPVDFLQKPLRWLAALSRYGGTVSGGPNFAYDLCARKIRPEDKAGLDLSRWEVAFNGAEPVRAETLDRFAAAFAPCGFRREALFPCYGLAEATLFVAGAGRLEAPVVGRFRTPDLERHRAVADEAGRPLVSSGRPAAGQEVAIVDPETLRLVPESAVGEIWVAGPSVARGYWGRSETKESAFRAFVIDGEGPFLRTGDLGFLAGGELFVTGRAKDLVIIRGRNHYPQDIELTVEKSHPALRPGCGAAFSVDEGGEERLVVVQELRREARNADPAEVMEAIRRAVAEEHEVQLQSVALIRTASLPKTSSGKVRRHACRDAFLEGTLAVLAAWEPEGVATGMVNLHPDDDLTTEAGARAWLAAEVAARAGVARTGVDVYEPIYRYALDSMNAMELAHAVEERLGAPVPMEAFFEGASVAGVVERAFAARAAQASVPATAPAANTPERPLSHGQRALWFLYLLDPESAAYNVPGLVTIEGELDAAALRRSFQAIVDRHSILRSTFAALQGEPVRRVHERLEVPFAADNVSRWTAEDFARRLDEEANRPFDLEAGPLLRVRLFERSKQEHVLLVVLHHIVTDFWSQGLLLQELDALYPAAWAGAEGAVPLPAAFYSEFVRWQREMLGGESGERLRSYWKERLAGELPVLDLPTDRPRPPVQTYGGATHRIRLPRELSARLGAIGRERGATLFMTLLAAFKALLYRYTGQGDLLVGVPTAGRTRAAFAGMLGYFINPVVLRSDLRGSSSFEELLEQVRRNALGAFEHQDYPFPLLVEDLQPERDPSRSPLFQVMFVLQKAPHLQGQDLTAFALNEEGARLAVGGLPLVSMPLEERIAQFDLTLTVGENAGELEAAFNYNTDLFGAETIDRMTRHFETLLAGIAADPARRVADLPLLTDAERYRMLVKWNHTRAYYPETALIHGLFEGQVDQTPSLPAVMHRGEELIYRELDRRANRLAHHLIARGAGPEELIGVCIERSPELIVAILGILKAGAAYLPLDPEYPRERLGFMLEDAGVRRVITQESLRPLLLQDRQILSLDADAGWETLDAPGAADSRPPLRGAADNAACVIYTSGSTGQPKGVVLTHRNLANLVVSFIRSYSPDVSDRMLPLTSIASASFVGEIFPILCADGALVLPDREEILDTARLIELIARSQVSILSTVPSLIATLNAMKEELPKLRLILAGGEALSAGDVDRILESATIVNGYGLTETSICSTSYPVGMADLQAGGALPIGRPLMNHQLYILDPELNLMPIGCTGSLYIAGDGVSRGYRNNPRLTADRFVPDPFEPGGRMYRTGDLASWLPDGNVLFRGRADQQVKVRGFRIELGEIETVLGAHRCVAEAAVVPRQEAGEKRLVAYVVTGPEEADAGEPLTAGILLAHLRERLPEYMVPSAFVFLPALPLSPNGKVDARALPAPERVRPELEAAYAAPKSELERIIAAVWQEALAVDTVGIHDNFFDLGGHSLLLARVHSRLREVLGRDLSLVELFKNPTVSSLAAALSAPAAALETAEPHRGLDRQERPDRLDRAEVEIAVVGLAGRFPGAKTVDQLWDNLRAGREAIHFFTDEELLAAGVDPELVANPDYVKAKGILGDVDQFDAALFGLAPREVELMDPQHRIFLECCWEALERAGYNSGRPVGRVGVFGGESMNTYLITNLLSHLELVASAETLQASLGNDKDPLTSRVSYKLNLKGPSITIQSASSTSLVAVHVACQSLINRDCDMALAGGISIHLPELSGYMFHDGGTTSPDGHCRTFDARAKGFVSGHGCGVVVLKRLADALRDGDHVHAVIKGSACNNDGSLKVSYTAPSVDGQVEVYSMAYANAGVSPDTLSYVECHGTATPMGDPIEIAALTQAFRAHTDRRNFCAIGSLKTNVGHLDSAAGVCGLIKAVLALEHREIPPSLHFERPNPQIDFANSPFFVNAALRDWETDGRPRRAGVTSLGMGGTNAHVILEEAPWSEPSGPSRPWKLLPLAAHAEAALETATSELAAFLDRRPLLDLADVAYTLQVGRRPFVHRRALLCRDLEDAVRTLESRDPERILTARQEAGDRPVVFLFTGQGSQYPNMGRGLYDGEPTFRGEVDRCCDLLRPHLGLDLREVLFPPPEGEAAAAERLRQTALAQPALFVVEYALATLWMQWGVRPQAMLGHSIGEYVAACLAGVFSLRDALALVAARGRLMQRLPGGSMLAVPLPEAEVLPLLGGELSLAAVNRPSLCVVAGPTPAVEALREELAARGIEGRPLHTSHAFHSAMMEPILAPFADRVRKVRLSSPHLPYLSNVTGTWIRPEEATDPEYWTAHVRSAVRFADGAAELLREPNRVFLEVGPGNVLTTLVRQHPARTPAQAVLPSLRHPREAADDDAFLLGTLVRLWLAGVEVDWSGFYAHERRRRVPLPTYPFQRQRYWVEPRKPEGRGRDRLETRRRRNLAAWSYAPVWKRTAPAPAAPIEDGPGAWLVFLDDCGLGAEALHLLEAEGRQVIAVLPGDRFARTGERSFTLDAWNAAGYDLLLEELAARDLRLGTVLHLWNVTAEPGGSSLSGVDRGLERGFFSLTFLAQALGKRKPADLVRVLAVSNGLQRVTGEEPLQPVKAALLGPCRVIPRELPHIACRSLDVTLPVTNGDSLMVLARRVLEELSFFDAPGEPVAALRGRFRWVQELEPLPLPTIEGPEGTPRLRRGGVYLITGGLGALGLEVAELLARTASAKLVLVGRTPLPEREIWSSWLAAHGEGDATSRRIQKLRAIEALGGEVMTVAADVADAAAVAAVRDAAMARFGTVHGVIHAAGRPGGGIVQVKTREAAEAVLAPKVKGALALDEVFRGRPLDFMVLFSSVTALLAQPGQVDYAAANAFLDAFAQERCARGAFTLSLGWDAWREVGMAVETAVPEELREWRARELKLGMSTAEGLEVFRRALAGASPWLVISTQDLAARFEQSRAAGTLAEIEGVQNAREAHPRPLLANAYVAPRGAAEQRIAVVWQELLGIETVGVHDNFFDLGGNSLMAIRVIARLKSELGVDVSEVTIFEAPTVAALARLLDPEAESGEDFEGSRSRGERRRAVRKSRRAPVEVG